MERDTVLEKCLTEPNPIIRALLSIEHSHYNSYKFTGWRRSRGVRRVGDKMGVFILIHRAMKNVTPLTLR